jgi:serine/threonine-protein kinase
MRDSSEALPRVLGGRYRLDSVLGRGGMGLVYRGMDLEMERGIAVKLIRPAEGDAEVAGARFLREIKSTAKLRHQHIVEVFDLGRSEEGGAFFVMELLEGESLDARLQREPRLAAPLAVHVATQICEALAVAHEGGIVHRDLKPANVMLVRRGEDDTFVKILDFGIAKSADHRTQLTQTGGIVGTLEYMAPEQIAGGEVDGRADVYSLGALLYRALAGGPVFPGGEMPAMMYHHLHVQPEPLSLRAPGAGIPRELDQVVLRCLEKQPSARYSSMTELAGALGRCLGAEIRATPDLPVTAALGRAPSPLGQPLPSGPSLPLDLPLPLELPPLVTAPRAPDPGAARAGASFDDLDDGEGPPMELAVAPPRTTTSRPLPPPRRCAHCHAENMPYARRCAMCEASLETPEQEAFREKLAAEQRAHPGDWRLLPGPPVFNDPGAPPPLPLLEDALDGGIESSEHSSDSLDGAPRSAPLAPYRGSPRELAARAPGPARGGLAVLPIAVWKRVLAYSALALLLGNAFFSSFSVTASLLLLLGMLLGAVGLWARWRSQRS